MLSRKLLSLEEITERLKPFSEWDTNGKVLSRDYQFKDFKEAFAFLTQAALVAEKLDHHPEIWNVYNKVSLKLSTHDTQPQGGGLTELDFEFISQLSNEPEKKSI